MAITVPNIGRSPNVEYKLSDLNNKSSKEIISDDKLLWMLFCKIVSENPYAKMSTVPHLIEDDKFKVVIGEKVQTSGTDVKDIKNAILVFQSILLKMNPKTEILISTDGLVSATAIRDNAKIEDTEDFEFSRFVYESFLQPHLRTLLEALGYNCTFMQLQNTMVTEEKLTLVSSKIIINSYSLYNLKTFQENKSFEKIVSDKELFWLLFCSIANPNCSSNYLPSLQESFVVKMQKDTMEIAGDENLITQLRASVEKLRTYFVRSLSRARKISFAVIPTFFSFTYLKSYSRKIDISKEFLKDHLGSLKGQLTPLSLDRYQRYIKPIIHKLTNDLGGKYTRETSTIQINHDYSEKLPEESKESEWIIRKCETITLNFSAKSDLKS